MKRNLPSTCQNNYHLNGNTKNYRKQNSNLCFKCNYPFFSNQMIYRDNLHFPCNWNPQFNFYRPVIPVWIPNCNSIQRLHNSLTKNNLSYFKLAKKPTLTSMNNKNNFPCFKKVKQSICDPVGNLKKIFNCLKNFEVKNILKLHIEDQ